MEKIKLDIRLDADKRTVAAILADNGYTVRKTTIKMSGQPALTASFITV